MLNYICEACTIFPLDSTALDSLNVTLDFSFPYGLRLFASPVGTPWSNSCQSPNLNFSPPPWWSGSLPDTSPISDVLNDTQIKSSPQHYFIIVVCDHSIQCHHTINYTRHCIDHKEARQAQAQFLPAMSWQLSGRGIGNEQKRKGGLLHRRELWPCSYPAPHHPHCLSVSERYNLAQGFTSQKKNTQISKETRKSLKK